MNRRRTAAFIGIYIGIILAMLFVFFFVQKQYGTHLSRPPKTDAPDRHSQMRQGILTAALSFSFSGQTPTESAVPFDRSPESLVKIHLRPEAETLPGPRSI